jgi:hypothetical protein
MLNLKVKYSIVGTFQDNFVYPNVGSIACFEVERTPFENLGRPTPTPAQSSSSTAIKCNPVPSTFQEGLREHHVVRFEVIVNHAAFSKPLGASSQLAKEFLGKSFIRLKCLASVIPEDFSNVFSKQTMSTTGLENRLSWRPGV